jgi:hypothetical protein
MPAGSEGSRSKKKKKKAYKKSDLKKALDKLWKDTVRLRTQSKGTWTKAMAALVTSAAKRSTIPVQTLKDNFKRRLQQAGSPESVALAISKKKADTTGALCGLEKRMLYEWIEYMRTRHHSPTPHEICAQVLLLFPVPVMESSFHRLQISWKQEASTTTQANTLC